MGPVVLRHHHQSGRVLVETVHDARAFDAADAGKAAAAMGDQRINQRAGFMPGGRMHHETFGLVDNDDVVIFVDDVKRDIFTQGLGGGRFRHVRL